MAAATSKMDCLVIVNSWKHSILDVAVALDPALVIGGNYMIPFCRDEISTRPARAEIILRLLGEINFHPGKAGHFSTSYSFKKPIDSATSKTWTL